MNESGITCAITALPRVSQGIFPSGVLFPVFAGNLKVFLHNLCVVRVCSHICIFKGVIVGLAVTRVRVQLCGRGRLRKVSGEDDGVPVHPKRCPPRFGAHRVPHEGEITPWGVYAALRAAVPGLGRPRGVQGRTSWVLAKRHVIVHSRVGIRPQRREVVAINILRSRLGKGTHRVLPM